MKKDKGFIGKLLILSISVGIIGALLFITVLKEYYLPVFPVMLAVFTLITLSFHLALSRILERKPEKFSYMFMGLSAGKLFLILILIIIYLLLRRETVISFLAGTFFLYVVFTFFEVKTLLRMVQGTK